MSRTTQIPQLLLDTRYAHALAVRDTMTETATFRSDLIAELAEGVDKVYPAFLTEVAEKARDLLVDGSEFSYKDLETMSDTEVVSLMNWEIIPVNYMGYGTIMSHSGPYVCVSQNLLNKKPVFLLGGRDAEMHTIRELLIEAGVPFMDAALGWGAKVSQYGEMLNGNPWYIAIEMEDDSALPYVSLVDHHGDAAHLPSSLEQVAKLVHGHGYELTRQQKLIAANDVAHIAGMRADGATDEEISAIRALDRKCQGVTAEDEAAAEAALSRMVRDAFLNWDGEPAHGMETIGGKALHVVTAKTGKTATVTDRLQTSENLIVFSIDCGEFNFFGDATISNVLGDKFGGWKGGADLATGGQSSFAGGYASPTEVYNTIVDLMEG